MNCEWIRNHATLYVYDELEDDARYEFERHLGVCPGCQLEVNSQIEFKDLVGLPPAPGDSASLLAASRMRLQEALDCERSPRWWNAFVFDLAGWMRQVRLSPALAAILLISGFAAGALTSYRLLLELDGAPSTAANGGTDAMQASIAGIRGIAREPGSNKVRIQFDTLSPQSIQGPLDDPAIQKLLLYAAHSDYNSGVRVDSIDLLARASLADRSPGDKALPYESAGSSTSNESSGGKSGDSAIREALLYALRYDKNPGVRLRALSGLRPFVGSDLRVRDAVLDALIKDSNPGVRSEAISMLSPVGADTSVRETLQHLAVGNGDRYIKMQAGRLLASFPDVQ